MSLKASAGNFTFTRIGNATEYYQSLKDMSKDPDCFYWCKSTCESHYKNMETEKLIFFAIGTLTISLAYVLNAYSDWIIKKFNMEPTAYMKLLRIMFEVGILIQLGFFVWWLWFYNA